LDKKRNQVQETLYPSFFVGKHPNANLCIPCCFNKPGGKQTTNREKCKAEVWDLHQQGKKSSTQIITQTKIIKESSKFPLEKGEWGFLPINLYNFLEIPYSHIHCNQDGQTCILRKGVQYSTKQSFIGALATIANPHHPLSIKKMKGKIARAITLDSFITYQHGTLTEIFKTEKRAPIHKSYHNTTIYKKLIRTKLGEPYLQEIISAYENFKKYLQDDNINIDYEYIWDIICTPNPALFPKGLNLIILTTPQNDITQKVDIICPSNHYSNNLFKPTRPSAIILSQEEFFEPIMERQKIVRGEDNIKSFFHLVGAECVNRCPWSLQTVLRQIGKIITGKCSFIPPYRRRFGPAGDTPQYLMKHNISLTNMFKRLKGTHYKIIKQVINLHTKVIGVLVENREADIVYVPSAPSVVNISLPTILINQDTKWWNTYQETVRLLKNIANLGDVGKKIPCMPKFKVVDDGKIVGILTATNQFVPTKPATLEDTHGDTLLVYNINTNIMESNKNIWSSTEKDQERIEIVKKIKLETNFYNTFRNTIRILLNQYKFKKIKKDIEETINKTNLSYWKKLEDVIHSLKRLATPFTEFVDIDISDIDAISICLNVPESKCNTFCGFSASHNTCQLLIPNQNLISENDNELIYYGRMADELIRYGRIRTFILKQNKFISFQKIDYNLKNDEVLLLEDILTDKYNNYFKNFSPIEINKYIIHPQTFYSGEPAEGPTYGNEFLLNQK